MIDFFITYNYLCRFKNRYEYLVSPQKMPHSFSSVAFVWQRYYKYCNDRLYCLSFFDLSELSDEKKFSLANCRLCIP